MPGLPSEPATMAIGPASQAMRNEKSNGWASSILLMAELRKRILTFRGAIDLPPCNASVPINELLMGLILDLRDTYPEASNCSNIASSETAETPMNQVMIQLYNVLKSVGESWYGNNDEEEGSSDSSMENSTLEQLSEKVLGKITELINTIKETRNPDEGSVSTMEMCTDTNSRKRATISPLNSPTSSLENSPRLFILEAVKKLKPIEMKYLPSQLVSPLSSQERAYYVNDARGSQVFDNRKAENVTSGFQAEMNSKEPEEFQDGNLFMRASGSDSSIMMSVTSYKSNMTTEAKIAAATGVPCPPSKLIDNICSTAQVTGSEPTRKSDANELPSMQRQPPPPPPPPLPPSSKVVACSGSSVKHDTNRSSEIQKIPPPPPPPPLPPKNLSLKETTVSPSPPPPWNPNSTESSTKGSMPPPPPPPGLGKVLQRPRNNSRLKRSILMVYVYQCLRKKEQGSASKSNKATQGKKSKVGKTAAAKQGMAEAIEEITRKSAYYQKIEEDAKKYAAMVLEIKAAVSTFETKDMEELLKFVSYVERNMEKLSDESQVLARFEDFPEKKLEALQGAGALYSKLKGMSKKLKEWKIEPPTGQLLDKIETYFNKIKREIETVELSKDEESKRFKSNNIHFDFNVLVQVKESMVDVSSSCMELALKEWREAKASKGANGGGTKLKGKATASGLVLWRTFQFAYRVYSFAGGQDDRADLLTRELAFAMEIDPSPK